MYSLTNRITNNHMYTNSLNKYFSLEFVISIIYMNLTKVILIIIDKIHISLKLCC